MAWWIELHSLQMMGDYFMYRRITGLVSRARTCIDLILGWCDILMTGSNLYTNRLTEWYVHEASYDLFRMRLLIWCDVCDLMTCGYVDLIQYYGLIDWLWVVLVAWFDLHLVNRICMWTCISFGWLHTSILLCSMHVVIGTDSVTREHTDLMIWSDMQT